MYATITNTFLITIPLFHLQYIPYLTANKLEPLQKIIDQYLKPGMSDNHKYLHLKDTGLSVPNLMTYYIDFKIKRIRKFISPISIFDETITNIFQINFNLEPKVILFAGNALVW